MVLEKNRQIDQWNRLQNPEIDAEKCNQLTLDKREKAIQWRKHIIFNKSYWNNWTPMCKFLSNFYGDSINSIMVIINCWYIRRKLSSVHDPCILQPCHNHLLVLGTFLLILFLFINRQSCHLQMQFYFFHSNMFTFYCLSLTHYIS